VEYEIDKELKITNRKEVLEMGIAKYNQECRNIVMRYSGLWETVVNRFGRWIDFRNDYKTMDLSFMESVWYVFKQLFNKGLVYRGRRIMPYSNACSTVLSNFEVQQNYKDVHDPSIHVSFPLKNDPNVKFLAWTTTPWTLPSNLALAVNPNFVYVKVKDLKRNEVFIFA
jgi:isoleucyl-tRNA synthetase